jgi:hypothetical protein
MTSSGEHAIFQKSIIKLATPSHLLTLPNEVILQIASNMAPKPVNLNNALIDNWDKALYNHFEYAYYFRTANIKCLLSTCHRLHSLLIQLLYNHPTNYRCSATQDPVASFFPLM